MWFLVQNFQNSQKILPKINKRVYTIIQDHRVLSVRNSIIWHRKVKFAELKKFSQDQKSHLVRKDNFKNLAI